MKIWIIWDLIMILFFKEPDWGSGFSDGSLPPSLPHTRFFCQNSGLFFFFLFFFLMNRCISVCSYDPTDNTRNPEESG